MLVSAKGPPCPIHHERQGWGTSFRGVSFSSYLFSSFDEREFECSCSPSSHVLSKTAFPVFLTNRGSANGEDLFPLPPPNVIIFTRMEEPSRIPYEYKVATGSNKTHDSRGVTTDFKAAGVNI